MESNALNANASKMEMENDVVRVEEVINEINNQFIKIDDKEMRSSQRLIKNFVENDLIERMKEKDELFSHMFKNIHHTGSVYNGTKVDGPDEFDLNVVLNLTLPLGTYHLKRDANCPPGYVLLNIIRPRKHIPKHLFKKFMNLLHFYSSENEQFFMDPKKVRSWFQGIIDKTLPEINQHFDQSTITEILHVAKRQSGPALTLIIYMASGAQINVDLAPVVQFKPQFLQFYPEVWKNVYEPRWLTHRPEHVRIRNRSTEII